MRKAAKAKCAVCGKEYYRIDRNYKETCSTKCALERSRRVVEYMRSEGRRRLAEVLSTANL